MRALSCAAGRVSGDVLQGQCEGLPSIVAFGETTPMAIPPIRSRSEPRKERIDISHDYAVCAWARHFNVTEKRVKEAVAAVGDDADRVREHLRVAPKGSEARPSAG